jgi:hypothetical protein
VLFHSLAHQTFKDYELICIDDLNTERFPAVREYAASLNIPLAALMPSKPKVRGKRFGQCNAINSGVFPSRFCRRRFWQASRACAVLQAWWSHAGSSSQ